MKYFVIATAILVLSVSCRTTYDSKVNDDKEAEIAKEKLYEESIFGLIDLVIVGTDVYKMCHVMEVFDANNNSKTPSCKVGSAIAACKSVVSVATNKTKKTIIGETITKPEYTQSVVSTIKGAAWACIKSASREAIEAAALAAAEETVVPVVNETVTETAVVIVEETVKEVTKDVVVDSVKSVGVEGMKDVAVESLKGKVSHEAIAEILKVPAQEITEDGIAAIAENVGKEVVSETVAEASKSLKSKLISKALLFAGCRVAGNVSAAAFEAYLSGEKPAEHFGSCRSVKDRLVNGYDWGACSRSLGRGCSAVALKGNVNFSHLFKQTDSTAESVLLGISDGSASIACMLGGPQIAGLCSVISEATRQAKIAWNTGNNEWAQCLGIDAMSACAGEYWGSGGWTNDGAVATSIDPTSEPCCLCEQKFYRDRFLIKDKKVGSKYWSGVIQSGDFETGNCKMLERLAIPITSDEDEDYYYSYGNCRKVTVKGDSCKPTGNVLEVLQNDGTTKKIKF